MKVKSTSIDSINYNPGNKSMAVKLKKGDGVYIYQEVSASIHDALITSDSIGKFFQKNIKGKFDFTKQEGGDRVEKGLVVSKPKKTGKTDRIAGRYR